MTPLAPDRRDRQFIASPLWNRNHLESAIFRARPNVHTCIVAMNDHGETYGTVALQIKDDTSRLYVRAAEFLNAGPLTTSPSSMNSEFSAATRATTFLRCCRA